MRVIILEDEKLASTRLIRMLKELNPGIEVLATLNNLEEAEQYFGHTKQEQADILFFDIQLGDGTSFELFDKFKFDCPVIFTTAYDQFALQAIKVRASDYLLKPIKIEELDHAIKHVLELATQKEEGSVDRQDVRNSRFLVKMGKSLKILTLEDIAYFYSDQKITLIFNWAGRKFPIDLSLNRIEEMLPPETYFRLNRRLIVHLKAIDDMQVYSKSRIKINLKPSLDEEILVSTEKAGSFKRWLGGVIPGME